MSTSHNEFEAKYFELISQYSQQFRKLSQPVADRILELLAQGVDINKAVSQALQENKLFGRNQDVLMSSLFKAAAYGYGIEPEQVSKPAEVKRILLHEAWAPDKMNLSKRLHGSSKEMRQEIIDTISASMRQQKTVVDMARDLYDGYNSGEKTINQAELPKYLDRLQRAAKRAAQGDKDALREFNKALKAAQRNIEKLADHDAPTKALKAAYSELVAAAESFNEKALEKAVHTAVEEKSRYLAERIARTETSAASGEAFFAEQQDNPDVIAYRWRLSSRHPRFDICDLYANADLYGLGKGVYPKDKFPKRPAHPHCFCLVEPVYEGEIHIDFDKEAEILDNAKFNAKACNEYLNSLSEQEQKQLFGADGWEAWKKGEDWKKHLRLWEGTGAPKTRFAKSDFVADDAVEKWYNKIVKEEPAITKDIKSVVEGAGGTLEGLEYKVKAKDSYLRKVDADYETASLNNPNITKEYIAGKINDAIRYTAVADEDSLYDMFKRSISQLEENQYSMVKLKNTWGDTFNPYKGINVVLQSPTGQNFELQFHTPASYDMKQNQMHRLYEEFRLPITSDERKEELRQLMLKMSRKLKKPRDIDKIR